MRKNRLPKPRMGSMKQSVPQSVATRPAQPLPARQPSPAVRPGTGSADIPPLGSDWQERCQSTQTRSQGIASLALQWAGYAIFRSHELNRRT